MEARLSGVLVDRYGKQQKAAYPTLCKGRYQVEGNTYYAIEEPTSLNTLELLPELLRIGVAAVKIEGRQRSPAYVGEVTRTWRAAIDDCLADPLRFDVRDAWMARLDKLAEGQSHTLGAYHRPWR
jgi:putative protease